MKRIPAKKAASDENLRRRRLKKKTKKFSEENLSRRLEKMRRGAASEQNLRRFKFKQI